VDTEQDEVEVTGLLFGLAVTNLAYELAERGGRMPPAWAITVATSRCFATIADHPEDPLAALDALTGEAR
jgi:hypothetical protein